MNPVLLQLSLPGASRFLAEVTIEGCREISVAEHGAAHPAASVLQAVPQARLLLTCDGLDRRIAQAEPWSAAELARRGDEDEPGLELRFLRLPGDARIAYLRPAADLDAECACCPLALALELLFPGTRGDRSIAVLELGPKGRADVLLMAGRDADGQVDVSSLQIWIHPQDSTDNIAREFSQRGGFAVPSRVLARGQGELLALATTLPTYPRARIVLGRTADDWASLASRALALLLLSSLATGAVAVLDLRALRSGARQARSDIEASQARIARAMAASPVRLASAASVDLASLIAAARLLWRPGSVVRASAHGDSRSLVVRWKVPHGALAGAPPGSAIPGASVGATPGAGDATRFAFEVAGAWSGEVPPGFVRSRAELSGDGDEVAIAFQSEAAVPRAAVRSLD